MRTGSTASTGPLRSFKMVLFPLSRLISFEPLTKKNGRFACALVAVAVGLDGQDDDHLGAGSFIRSVDRDCTSIA